MRGYRAPFCQLEPSAGNASRAWGYFTPIAEIQYTHVIRRMPRKTDRPTVVGGGSRSALTARDPHLKEYNTSMHRAERFVGFRVEEHDFNQTYLKARWSRNLKHRLVKHCMELSWRG